MAKASSRNGDTREVRTRLTATAAVIAAVATLLAAFALITVVRVQSERGVRTAADLRARDFVALLHSGTTPVDLHIHLEEDVVVQVVAADGTVLAASPNVLGRPVIADGLPAGNSTVVDGSSVGDDDDYLVVAREVATGNGPITVLVGRDLDSVRETTQVVTGILLIVVPILLIVVTSTAWLLVGRALVPVEEARDTQRRWISDASHELRNPLAAIRQHVEGALANKGSTEVDELARDVRFEALRLQDLVEDLLILARADEATKPPSMQTVDLGDLALEESARAGKMSGIPIETLLNGARAKGDPQQLRRAVRNLVDNAVHHASARVTVQLLEVDHDAVLRVDDDGPGIPQDQRDVVFRRFTRLDDARDREHGGAGLGLSIVAAVAEAHGGRVNISESPWGGARFEMILPTVSE